MAIGFSRLRVSDPTPATPTTVDDSGLQVAATWPLAVVGQGLGTNQIAFVELRVFAVSEDALGIYSEVWRVNVQIQLLSGGTYRLGTVTSSKLNTSSAFSTLDTGTPLSVDQSGGNLRLLAKAGNTVTAKVWAVCVHTSLNLP